MLFGTNKQAWTQLTAATAGANAFRAYNQPEDGIPASWPGPGNTVPPGAVGIISLRPNVADFLAGKLDEQFKAFLGTIPNDMMLTFWHEGNRPPLGLNSADFVQMTMKAHSMVATYHRVMKFGPIFSAYQVYHGGQDLREWVAPGCDFYGLDCYPSAMSDTPSHVIGLASFDIKEAAELSDSSKIVVTETNSQFGDGSAWILDAFEYIAERRYGGFLPFFNAEDGSYQWSAMAAKVMPGIAAAAAQL